MAAWGQILVSIDLNNRCRHDLEVGAIWFNIVAYRDGGVVQGRRGNLVRSLRRNERRDMIVALPGSLDWYDKITVQAYEGTPSGQ